MCNFSSDVDIADHITQYCREKGYGPTELITALVRLSAITLTVLNHSECSGQIGKYKVVISLHEKDIYKNVKNL